MQARVGYLISAAMVLRAEGRPGEALAAIQEALAPDSRLPARHVFAKHGFVEGVEAALETNDLDVAEELLGEWERMRPVDRTPFLEAHWERFAARLAARRGASPAASRTADMRWCRVLELRPARCDYLNKLLPPWRRISERRNRCVPSSRGWDAE